MSRSGKRKSCHAARAFPDCGWNGLLTIPVSLTPQPSVSDATGPLTPSQAWLVAVSAGCPVNVNGARPGPFRSEGRRGVSGG